MPDSSYKGRLKSDRHLAGSRNAVSWYLDKELGTTHQFITHTKYRGAGRFWTAMSANLMGGRFIK